MKPMMVSGIIVTALAGYVGFQGIHAPTQRALQKLDQQLAEERTAQELRVNVARSIEDFERLRKRLPAEASSEWLLREVTRRAEEEGIRLHSIVPQDRKELRDGTQFSVHLQLMASYHQLGQFLSSLEQSSPFVWVEDVQILRQNDSDPPKIRLTVSTLSAPPGITGGKP